MVSTDPEDPAAGVSEDEEIVELRRRLAENDAILAELMFRQDSMEQSRQRDLENRFERVMRMVRQETGGNRPDLEEKAQTMYFLNNDKTAVAENGGEGKDDRAENRTPAPLTPNTETTTVTPKTAITTSVATSAGQPKDRTEVRTPEALPENTATLPGKTTVKQRKFRDLPGVTDGYYLVANVYSGTKYMEKFIQDMKAAGFEPDVIDNPENGLKYVYLRRFETFTGAEDAVITGLEGSYRGALWVMNVSNKYTNEAYAATSEKVASKASKYDDGVLRQNVVERDQLSVAKNTEQELAVYGEGTAYYIIANVFSDPNNANRFVRYLNSKGLNASYFINPENNYRYVYLKRHENWNSALISYYSKLNDTYDEKMWIMRVRPNQLA
jgi:hypothetical protein